jgi:cytochrome oxidase Cu insertion factor (SCO1/SenC/PrrC family)
VSEAESRKRRRSRAVLVTLFVLAIAPVAASYLLYYAVRDDGPWATSNRGDLLDGGVSARSLRAVSPASVSAATIDGHWWLLLVADGRCEMACVDAADRLRTVHVLLNKDASRLRRGLLVRDPVDGDGGFAALAATDDGLARLDGTFAGIRSGIYLIDPLGNVVLHYDYAAAGKPVLDDVKKLLKVSQIG